jgi:uncharacterized protein YodC (DUF2158 family)
MLVAGIVSGGASSSHCHWLNEVAVQRRKLEDVVISHGKVGNVVRLVRRRR